MIRCKKAVICAFLLVVFLFGTVAFLSIREQRSELTSSSKTSMTWIPSKIYRATNDSIVRVWDSPWYKVFDAYYLTASGIKGKLWREGYLFCLQHPNAKINIYRWSGSFLDLDRHWYMEFLNEDNEVIGTFKTAF